VVGLALLVSTDFNIPLFSRVYPGNQPDSITFGSVTEELIKRYCVLAKNLEHVTLVFDKGNHSEENLEGLVPSRRESRNPLHELGRWNPDQVDLSDRLLTSSQLRMDCVQPIPFEWVSTRLRSLPTTRRSGSL